MRNEIIDFLKKNPELYADSDDAFWDDEHISKYMLAAHLNPDCESASRKQEEIIASVEWITNLCKDSTGNKLLDLGCGPGIYAEHLTRNGFKVTGIDFSKRSINYAKKSCREKGLDITYHYQNYLDIDYKSEFDIAILIYCDLGVLSPVDRRTLLKKVYRALKPGGILILDVFHEAYARDFKELQTISYHSGGFWSPEDYVLIQRNMYFTESKNTLEQYLIITEDNCKKYNIWNQIYTKESLVEEISKEGFQCTDCFDDVRGNKFTGEKNTICAVFRK